MNAKFNALLPKSEPHLLYANDAAALTQLESACFSSSWTERQFTEAFNRTDFYAFGINLDGQLASYVSLSVMPPDAEIQNIATKVVFRRQGLAYALLKNILAKLPGWGVERLFLEVGQNNEAANALYFSLGFKCLGRRIQYYQATSEDALLMVYDYAAQKGI